MGGMGKPVTGKTMDFWIGKSVCLLEELKKLGAALWPVTHFVGQVPVGQKHQLESSLSRDMLCSATPVMVIPYTGINAIGDGEILWKSGYTVCNTSLRETAVFSSSSPLLPGSVVGNLSGLNFSPSCPSSPACAPSAWMVLPVFILSGLQTAFAHPSSRRAACCLVMLSSSSSYFCAYD